MIVKKSLQVKNHAWCDLCHQAAKTPHHYLYSSYNEEVTQAREAQVASYYDVRGVNIPLVTGKTSRLAHEEK